MTGLRRFSITSAKVRLFPRRNKFLCPKLGVFFKTFGVLMSKVVFTDKFAVDFRAFTLAKLIFLERKLPRMNREFS